MDLVDDRGAYDFVTSIWLAVHLRSHPVLSNVGSAGRGLKDALGNCPDIGLDPSSDIEDQFQSFTQLPRVDALEEKDGAFGVNPSDYTTTLNIKIGGA